MEVVCSRLNHNGQLAIVGTRNGSVLVVDLRKGDIIDQWSSLDDPVVQIELTTDYTMCYALHEDNKVSAQI